MKKLLALSKSACLCLGATAAATDAPALISPAPETVNPPILASYGATVTIDGVEVDTAGIPGAPAGYVPMRAVTEAADGIADYYPDENLASFFLDNNRISVNLTDLTVEVEFEPVEGATAYLNPNGYTFLPVSVLNGLGAITVDENPEMDVERYDIKTSASDPMVKLTNEIEAACDLPGISPVMDFMLTELEFDMNNYTHLVARAPMINIKAGAVFVAEVAEGKMDAAKENFQAYLEQQQASFQNYLEDQYQVAKNGQIVVSPDGNHLILIISENNDAAVELFNAAYPAAE